jgi:LPS export ABC transporter protein LptC/lipopolysaccharide transport protein LptA
MTPWQRRARTALGIFVVAFAALLYFAVRRPQPAQPVRPLTREDPRASAEASRGEYAVAKGTRQELRIEYEKLLHYPDGRARLANIKAKIPRRAGRDFVVTGRELETGPNQSDIVIRGDVRVTASDGLQASTGEATYDQDEGLVRAPGPVRFSRGRMQGSGVGMTYDKNRDVLSLLAQAVITTAPDQRGSGATTIRAGTASLARADHYARFERGVKVTRDGQTIEAENAVAFLTPDNEHVQMIELRGGSRVGGAPQAAGSLQSMRARDINLVYADDGQALQRAVLAGEGTIQIAGKEGARGKRITGEYIDLDLAPDGTTVTSIAARSSGEGAAAPAPAGRRVQLDLPAEGEAPAQTVRSDTLQGSSDPGNPGSGVTSANFAGDVEYTEVHPAPAAPRVAHARVMALTLKPGFGDVDAARFSGGVRFEEGTMKTCSSDARYLVPQGVIEMAGACEQAGTPPQAVDEQVSITAQRIRITLDKRIIAARDHVQSVLKPQSTQAAGERKAGGTDTNQARMPGLLKQDEPTNVTSDELEYNGEAHQAVYRGSARLWQGPTTIKSERLVLDDSKGDLTATGSVVSTMLLEQTNEKTKAREQVPSTGKAAALHYEDALRRATYTTNAQLDGPQGNLTADKIEMYLRPNANEIDHLEAYSAASVAVKVRTPDGRSATGLRLSYVSADERYDMKGAPATAVEECRVTTGRTLTFFKSVDRIVVDGNEESRTQTKGSQKCPGSSLK